MCIYLFLFHLRIDLFLFHLCIYLSSFHLDIYLSLFHLRIYLPLVLVVSVWPFIIISVLFFYLFSCKRVKNFHFLLRLCIYLSFLLYYLRYKNLNCVLRVSFPFLCNSTTLHLKMIKTVETELIITIFWHKLCNFTLCRTHVTV